MNPDLLQSCYRYIKHCLITTDVAILVLGSAMPAGLDCHDNEHCGSAVAAYVERG